MILRQERPQLKDQSISDSQEHSGDQIGKHRPGCKNGIQLESKDNYINQIVQVARTEVSQHILNHSQYLFDLYFSLLTHISLALHEPAMQVVTCLEKYDETDQQKEENVVKYQLRVVLQRLKAMDAEIYEVGHYKQQVGDMMNNTHYKITSKPGWQIRSKLLQIMPD